MSFQIVWSIGHTVRLASRLGRGRCFGGCGYACFMVGAIRTVDGFKVWDVRWMSSCHCILWGSPPFFWAGFNAILSRTRNVRKNELGKKLLCPAIKPNTSLKPFIPSFISSFLPSFLPSFSFLFLHSCIHPFIIIHFINSFMHCIALHFISCHFMSCHLISNHSFMCVSQSSWRWQQQTCFSYRCPFRYSYFPSLRLPPPPRAGAIIFPLSIPII